MLNRVTAAQAIEQVVASLRAGADASEVLSTLLAQARSMLEADEAHILIREGRSLRLRAAVGSDDFSRHPDLAWGEGVEGLAAARGEAIAVVDATRDACYRAIFSEGHQVGAIVAYPMMMRGEVIGVIAATRRIPGRFSGLDLWWLDLLGGLAGVVIENDRVRRAQERRVRQAEVLLDIVSQSGGEPESLLQRLADTLTRDLDVDRVDVLLLDEDGRNLVCLGTAGAAEPDCKPPAVPIDRGSPLVGVLQTGQPYLWTDVLGDPELRQHLRGGDMRSALAVPIVVEGRRQGVLLLAARQPGAFGPEDQAFALVIAARLGVLVEEAALRRRRSELERAEAEAAARQEFIGVVSHELKTPVAVIQAYTDVLLRRAERAGDAGNLDVLRRIGEQSERMLHMVEQILDLQRLEAGLMALETSRFDLVALTQRVVEEVGSITSQHRLTVEGSGPLPVVADRRRVEEVLQNLLQNAIKFSPNGGNVRITVTHDERGGGRAIVAVSDEGIGISPEEQPRVFERFYQGRNRLYQGHVGLGLGLYISRELVRRHGGDMWLESQPGVGSTFYFWLPVAGPDEGEP